MSIAPTPSARKVLQLLSSAEKPLSAYDILSKLTRIGMRSPPTVYRALDQLSRLGFVHKLESLNAFIACRCPDTCREKNGHINSFAICTSCKVVKEFTDQALEKAMKKLGKSFLASTDKKTVEITGICHSCSRNCNNKGQ